jgi:hypothetical protein
MDFYDSKPDSTSKNSRKEEKGLFGTKENAINIVFVISIYAIGLFLVLFLIRILHYIKPGLWLCPYHLDEIDKFVYTGVFGAVFGRQVAKLAEGSQ